jgi:glutamate formiminotransferase
VLDEIATAIRASPGVRLYDYSGDPDHNRSVFTFAGRSTAVIEAMWAAAQVAIERIDLTGHAGVHPRIGAVDVVPFVPLAGADLALCARVAHDFGQRLWEQLRVPVFLYESAAVRPERRGLEQVRHSAREGGDPDIGDGRHSTAGACAVGARDFLIAWNIWLNTADLSIAKQIARAIRFSSGGFPGVKALGLPLESHGIVQISINSTDFRATPLVRIFNAVRDMAERAGTGVRGSELIGMIPSEAIADSADLSWLNLSPDRVLPDFQ